MAELLKKWTSKNFTAVQSPGIEPGAYAWQAYMLPLHQLCVHEYFTILATYCTLFPMTTVVSRRCSSKLRYLVNE